MGLKKLSIAHMDLKDKRVLIRSVPAGISPSNMLFYQVTSSCPFVNHLFLVSPIT